MGSPSQYNIGSPNVKACLLVETIALANTMFNPSITSDLIESLVDWLNTDNTVSWYYVSGGPEAVQPGEAIGIVQLIKVQPKPLGDPSHVEITYQVSFNIYYHYNDEQYQSIKAFSWLNQKVSSLLRTGFTATFSNQETYRGLLAGGQVVNTRFNESSTQDSLIQSACEITIQWSRAWYPQPYYSF